MFGQWKLHDFAPGSGTAAMAHTPDYDDSEWIDVAVPGDVHLALLAAGRIPDPFFDRNEAACAWMEEREWWYRGGFDCTNRPLAGERLRLVFHGLDTFVTIWLNGKFLGQHQNMFRPAIFDVTEHVNLGQPNILALCFDRPLDHLGEADITHWWEGTTPRVAMRKAQFGYGWDWGPRLPTIGIWRPLELRHERQASISGVQVTTLESDPSSEWAILAVKIEAERFGTQQPLTARVRLTAPHALMPLVDQTVSLLGQTANPRTTTYLSVDHPQLWWTHDLGEPARYTLDVELSIRGETLDRQQHLVGIRTITLDQSPDPDEPGTRFFRFVLNGVPIFARGANWIPADSFVGAIPPARYRELITQARDANMTMLRVWGGGIYEHDAFYEVCDELGILVWQDFMFACAPYPDNLPDFVAEVKAEARYQVRRLRNHPCLALWCGNNENQWLHDLTFWDQPGKRVPGALLYDTVLPQAVADEDGHTPYWPGSPYGGDDYNSMDDGDRHNWDAWHGNRPFRRRFNQKPERDISPEGVSYTNYAADMGRFISEFGLHAAPVRATLDRVIPPDQRYYHSPAMDHHNKDTPKNKGDNLMAAVTGLPQNIEHYIDFSMIAQAEGLKYAIEHYRRRKPHCSGTLFWQLNDCWPVLSWSVLDYYGVGKAGYYYAKRAYAPVLASFKQCPDGSIQLWITNDTLAFVSDTITLALCSFAGQVLWSREHAVSVPSNSSASVYQIPPAALQVAADRYLTVRSAANSFPANRHFFAAIKDLVRSPIAPSVSMSVVNEQEIHVQFQASVYAYFVHLTVPHTSIWLNDNYFDLAPHTQRTIIVRTAQTALAPEDVRISWQ